MRLSFCISDEHLYHLACASVRSGFQTNFWQKSATPIYDMLDRFNPEVLVCNSNDIGTLDNIALDEFNETQVVKIDELGLPPFGSALVFHPSQSDELYQSDLFYYSADPAHRFKILDLAEYANENSLKLKVVGPSIVYNCPNYLGQVASQETFLKLLASTKIAVDFDGKFIMNAALSRTFCLSAVDNDDFPLLNELSDISNWLNRPDERVDIAREAFSLRSQNDTEFHRLSQILSSVGYAQPAEGVIKTLCGT